VNHLLVSSEPLLGENVWNRLTEGEIVAVDPFLRFHHFAPPAGGP
jgi:predicted glutamine amidotransferase